jgi:hypothetical protein
MWNLEDMPSKKSRDIDENTERVEWEWLKKK